MIRVIDGNIEQAISVFTEKSKDRIKEARRYEYFKPEKHKRSRRGKTNSKNNQRNRKRY